MRGLLRAHDIIKFSERADMNDRHDSSYLRRLFASQAALWSSNNHAAWIVFGEIYEDRNTRSRNRQLPTAKSQSCHNSATALNLLMVNQL